MTDNRQAIDARIDAQLRRLRREDPIYDFLNKVYRPFVQHFAEMERADEDPAEVVSGSVVLIANMIHEITRATAVPKAKIFEALDEILEKGRKMR
jgi:hypothetical protein